MNHETPCPPPRSATSVPATALPANACDAHAHLFGLVKRYPYRLARYYTPLDAALDHFLRLHETLGVSRDALTQPSVLGTHNAALVEAVARHPERLWAVVALGTDVTEQTNYVMHAGRAQARVVGLRLAVCNVPHRDA